MTINYKEIEDLPDAAMMELLNVIGSYRMHSLYRDDGRAGVIDYLKRREKDFEKENVLMTEAFLAGYKACFSSKGGE